MSKLRFAIFGTGFWSRYQLAGWRELPDVECIALYNRTRSKADALAHEFNVPAVYDDPQELLDREKLDFIDIIADADRHRPLVEMAAARKIPVICQKPMASTLHDSEAMVAICRKANVPLFIHENWRWQTPIREFQKIIASGKIGKMFRARIDYKNSFPVFDNQPFLKELKQFILVDIGTHILDVARFLCGEAIQLCCQTQQIHRDIQGEDVATVLMKMQSGSTVTCNMSYASRVEHDRFPETYVFVEGTEGSAELSPDFWLRLTTREGTLARRCPPPFYAWADPRYALVHASIVPCHENLVHGLRQGGPAETTGEDNLKTIRLVFAAYESAASGKTVLLSHD